jgi:lipid-A-disaccharide synthase
MLDAVEILRSREERTVNAYIIQAPTIEHELLEEIVRAKGSDVPILPHDRGEGVAAADVAICASGTATLEAAILGTPVVVMYRLSRLTYILGKKLVQLPNFSLVNIIGEKEIVPELVQSDVNGERIATEVRRMVAPGRYEQVCAELARIREKLGAPGASARAAMEIHKMVRG